ncbi:UV radiation resistance protein [Helicobacter pylori]|uniref:UV radiation resistance protein n=1 Tax=Helicobacter pylori TaxID=210 RepID=UPI000680D0E6|nr:UV radiation resistance protein [Helicobacter pylori]KNE11101.1 UV radiation resistance protein [Helicobacter pylori]
MSWIDIGVSPGSSGLGSSNEILRGIVNSLWDSLNNAGSEGIRGFPWQFGSENEQIVGYYDDPTGYYKVIKKFLAQKNYHSNSRLKDIFKRLIEVQNRINHLNHEIADRQNAINRLNNEIHQLNQEIGKQDQALNNLNQEIASLDNEINANTNAIKQDEEKLNALELGINAKKQIEKEIKESLKRLEELKKELQRLKKQSKWKTQFNFLTDNPPNIQAQQESALNRSSKENARMNFFLTNPYAILPKGFIYEYHNPGKETYNALNAPNNMDGINNQFRTNALNQVLDNSYQKFLPGNDSYNALGSIEQVKALKFYDLVLNYNPQSEKLESALFFKQISQYAKGLRLKILSAPSSNKDLARLKKLENTINQEEERLNAKDLNALEQEILKEQENALKLKESIKAKQNYTETLKNAINQKEQAKNPIEQQKQNLESQRNEKEREKQNQEHDKRNQEQERNELNNEIDFRGDERVTLKQLGTSWDFLGVQPYLNNNGWGRTYARAFFSDKTKRIREHYEIEVKIKNILGFYRFGESDERILHRFLELPPYQQNELARLLLE